MAQTTLPQTRWQEIEKIWKDNRWLYVVAGILIGIISVPAIEQITGDLNTLIGNLVPETIGIIFTVLILNRAADNRAKEELKHQLLEDLKSTSASPAVNALDRLRRERWLDDDYFMSNEGKNLQRANWEGAYIGGLTFENANMRSINLKKVTVFDRNEVQCVIFEGANLKEAQIEDADLRRANFKSANLDSANFVGTQLDKANLHSTKLIFANLEKAKLRETNLEKADLRRANLHSTDLMFANLKDASLRYARLHGATLLRTNLEGASLVMADLEGADLFKANLEGTELIGANLEGAVLSDVQLDNVIWTTLSGNSPATLPDGTKWTPKEDMKRFTDENHAKFEETLAKINEIRVQQGRETIKLD